MFQMARYAISDIRIAQEQRAIRAFEVNRRWEPALSQVGRTQRLKQEG